MRSETLTEAVPEFTALNFSAGPSFSREYSLFKRRDFLQELFVNGLGHRLHDLRGLVVKIA